MITRKTWARLTALLALLWLVFQEPAAASFHLMMVVEVFPGFTSNPSAQYIELQMWSPGQHFVAGHVVTFFNAAGTAVGTLIFPSDVPNGSSQASILIATTQAQTLFGVTANLIMPTPLISAAGGKVCWAGVTDCVAWGSYSGSSAGVGSPFSPGGLTLGQAMQRRLGDGVLDPGDDTDNSAADFAAAAPTPRNNAGIVGTVAGYSSTPAAPGPITFGSVVLGFSASASFTVQETGGRTLTVSDPVIGGTNPGDFSVVTPFPIGLPDGSPSQMVQLACTPQDLGTRMASLTLTTNDPARPTVAYDLSCAGSPVPPPLTFFTVTPCRLVDTRLAGGPLVAGSDRTFSLVGPTCGIPATAKAVSLNIAVTQSTKAGNVRLFPAGTPVPTTSNINYGAGQTRANNIVVGLSATGELTAHCSPSGSTHLILDVNGYFE